MTDLWSYFWSCLWSYLAVVISLAAFLSVLGSIVWVCGLDARRRGKSPFLVCLLVFVSFPLGLILWLLFRPEPLNGRRQEQEQERKGRGPGSERDYLRKNREQCGLHTAEVDPQVLTSSGTYPR